jgi:hypothetical protein
MQNQDQNQKHSIRSWCHTVVKGIQADNAPPSGSQNKFQPQGQIKVLENK